MYSPEAIFLLPRGRNGKRRQRRLRGRCSDFNKLLPFFHISLFRREKEEKGKNGRGRGINNDANDAQWMVDEREERVENSCRTNGVVDPDKMAR